MEQDKPKPKVERLFDTNMQFALRNQAAGFNVEKWKESRQIYRYDLRQLGIADMFDWDGE